MQHISMEKTQLLFESLAGSKIRCTACARYCQLSDGQIGLCGIRGNVNGKLELFVYGKVIAGNLDPIEKKPVVHYRPGTRVFSIATTGCNWLCQYCQNYDISQRRKIAGEEMNPSQVVQNALNLGAEGIAYTYNEPTIFMEFARDCGVLARKDGLYNVFVSNGYATPESIDMMNDFLDAITIDFKGSGEPDFTRKYIGIPDANPVFDTLIRIRDKTSIHLEITDLIVPSVGDNLEYAEKLCRFIYDQLGPDVPIHFLKFHPDYKMRNLPETPLKMLEKHHSIAKKEGLRYAYIGNVPGHPLENTFCPECKSIVVKRFGFNIDEWYLDSENSCMFCGNKIPIVGSLPKNYRRNKFRLVP